MQNESLNIFTYLRTSCTEIIEITAVFLFILQQLHWPKTDTKGELGHIFMFSTFYGSLSCWLFLLCFPTPCCVSSCGWLFYIAAAIGKVYQFLNKSKHTLNFRNSLHFCLNPMHYKCRTLKKLPSKYITWTLIWKLHNNPITIFQRI